MNKMKLYEFLRLSEVEQYNPVWSFGVHVDTHIKDNIAINLYSINDFYCEVYYEMKTNKIPYKQVFKQGARLDKYLDRIKI
ncbi:hypothetical protein CXF59_01120 [Flavobacterium sp. ALD4]|nr:hypothetical protein CXF59_01120 [Flavobacterium sp. ALD4]